MNRRFIAFASALLFVLGTFSIFSAAEDVSEQIKKLEMDRAAAVVKGDWAKLEKETSDDYTLINANGEMSNKSQMIERFKSGQNKLTKDDLSDMNVRVYGNAAVVTGKADIAGIMGGKDVTGQIMFTRVYVKKGNQWQSVALQQTRVSNP